MELIDSLIEDGWLKTPRIIEAFKKIRRVDFLPEDIKNLAELNEALPIGFGQTISQPLVVAFMIEQLNPQPGEKILDIGSGSGWTSALLAEIVGAQGRVIAIEVIPELKDFGEKNVSKYNFVEKGIVKFICADGSKGYQKEAPYDKILASASAKKLPPAWKEQLKIGGRIVTPIGSSIWLFIKKLGKEVAETPPYLPSRPAERAAVFEEIEYPGFVFVPLVTGNRKQGTGNNYGK
jgi:protein-L-isoaspartate(D-aspartate) O-methyltransferase